MQRDANRMPKGRGNKRNTKALIIVDVQRDFCPGGSLAVTRGDEVVNPLNKMIEIANNAGAVVIATRDWHPGKTAHFKDFGGPWPAHCVQGTEGAEFHPALRIDGRVIVVSKGIYDGEDAYSGFAGKADNRNLRALLEEWGVDTVYVAGLATDYCVKATALDAVKYGFKTFLIDDCCRAANVNQNDGDNAVWEMARAGVKIIESEKVYF